MKRREFITLLGGAAAWPLAARAQQQPAIPVVGFLHSGSPAEVVHLVAAFHRGLKDVGYVEGQNVVIEYAWAKNQDDWLPALAAHLVQRQVTVIAATGGAMTWVPAKAATATIPIIFQGGGDPIRLGLIQSLSRPGGNATGIINISPELTTKRLEVLRELVPSATMIAVLTNRNNPTAEDQLRDLTAAALGMRQKFVVVDAGSDREIDDAFATVALRQSRALLVVADAVFTNRREHIVELATRLAIPAIYSFREFPAVGGLSSFGASLTDEFSKTGLYVGRILKGGKPAELPVQQPTKFELVINLRAAKALGLTISPALLARADELIE